MSKNSSGMEEQNKPSSIREQELDKKRRVFKQTFDSPLKIRWNRPPVADIQEKTFQAMIGVVPKIQRDFISIGLHSIGVLLASLARGSPSGSPVTKELQIIVALFNGDFLPGTQVLKWIASLAQISSKQSGIRIYVLNFSVEVLAARMAEVIFPTKKAQSQLSALALQVDGSQPWSRELLELANQFPQPSVPFYDHVGGTACAQTLIKWQVEYQPVAVKTLDTTMPLGKKLTRRERRLRKRAGRRSSSEVLSEPSKPAKGVQQS